MCYVVESDNQVDVLVVLVVYIVCTLRTRSRDGKKTLQFSCQ